MNPSSARSAHPPQHSWTSLPGSESPVMRSTAALCGAREIVAIEHETSDRVVRTMVAATRGAPQVLVDGRRLSPDGTNAGREPL
jgi:hypothetical protein